MIVKLHNGVQVGDFIRSANRNAGISRARVWRKVIERTPDDVLITVDRHGTRREFTYQAWNKWKTWEPGDPRDDGDNL
jgi:hypothetical protein